MSSDTIDFSLSPGSVLDTFNVASMGLPRVAGRRTAKRLKYGVNLPAMSGSYADRDAAVHGPGPGTGGVATHQFRQEPCRVESVRPWQATISSWESTWPRSVKTYVPGRTRQRPSGTWPSSGRPGRLALRPGPALVDRDGPYRPPASALAWEESTTQRDQSRREAAFNSASRISCSRC